MLRNSGEITKYSSFHKASEAAAEALRRGEKVLSGTGYGKSFYAPALRRYVELFGKDVLVVLHDDLSQDKENTHKRILAFLGVDPTYTPAELNHTYNVGYGNTRSGIVQRMIFSNGGFKKAVKALLPQSVRYGIREAAIRLNRANTTELSRETLLTYTPLFNDDILDTARLIRQDLSGWLVGKTASPPPASVNAEDA